MLSEATEFCKEEGLEIESLRNIPSMTVMPALLVGCSSSAVSSDEQFFKWITRLSSQFFESWSVVDLVGLLRLELINGCCDKQENRSVVAYPAFSCHSCASSLFF